MADRTVYVQDANTGEVLPMLLHDNGGGTYSPATYSKAAGVVAATPVLYRTAVAAADVCAVPGTVTCTLINSVGDLGASALINIAVIAGNGHGRTTHVHGNTAVQTTHPNECVKAAFAAVVGATFYDIYASTDAHPLWVGRITEAQRASGIIIDAVGSVAVGGAVNSVYVYVVGTGLAADVQAVNTAYIPPAGFDCSGYQYADLDVAITRTGDAVAPALTWVPMYYNSVAAAWSAGDPEVMDFGGAAGKYNSLRQRYRLEVRGNSAISFVVQSIAGTGTAVTVHYTLS